MEELQDYVKLLDLGQPDFIEIKGGVLCVAIHKDDGIPSMAWY